MSQPAPPRFRHARTLFLSLTAAGFVLAVALGRAIILPFLLGILVAYVLFPLVRQVERVRVPRWAAILIVYFATIGAGVGFVWAVVPRLVDEVKSLAADLPSMTERVREEWLPKVDERLQRLTGGEVGVPPPPSEPKPDEAPIVIRPREDGSYEVRIHDEVRLREDRDGTWVLQPKAKTEQRHFSSERALRDAFDRSIGYLQTNSLELVKLGRSLVSGISRGVFYFFITLMLAGYMIFTYERIHAFVREMWPPYRRDAFDRFLHRLDRGLAGVVRGQLLICLVNGVLTAIGLWIFDVKYWPVLSIVAAVMSLIPIFGSILSTIPAVAIALTQSFGTALGVLLWIVGIHQLEANFLNPKIIGDQAKIHPILVVFSLLLGEHLFSITGALLAVPTLALVQAIFLHFRESVMGLSDEPAAISIGPASSPPSSAAPSSAAPSSAGPSTPSPSSLPSGPAPAPQSGSTAPASSTPSARQPLTDTLESIER